MRQLIRMFLIVICMFSLFNFAAPQTFFASENFKEKVEKQQNQTNQKIEESQTKEQSYSSGKATGRWLTLVLLILWIIGTYFIYSRYRSAYKITFKDNYYSAFPSDDPPGEISALINCTTHYSPEILSSILSLIDSGEIRADIFPDLEKDEHYGLILNIDKESELSEPDFFLVDWLFNKIGNGQFVTLKAIENNAVDVSTSKDFQNNYSIWVSLITQNCEEKNLFDYLNRNLKLVAYIYGLIFIIVGLVITQIFGSVLSSILVLLGAFSIYHTLKFVRRSQAGEELYVKWMAFKRFLIDFDFSALDMELSNEGLELSKYIIYSAALNIHLEFINRISSQLDDYDGLPVLLTSFEEDYFKRLENFTLEFSTRISPYTSGKSKRNKS